MTLNGTWAVVLDSGHVSILNNDSFTEDATAGRHDFSLENACSFLEEMLAKHKFAALILVGAPLALNRFRKSLNAAVRRHVVAEVLRPYHQAGSLDENIQKIYA